MRMYVANRPRCPRKAPPPARQRDTTAALLAPVPKVALFFLSASKNQHDRLRGRRQRVAPRGRLGLTRGSRGEAEREILVRGEAAGPALDRVIGRDERVCRLDGLEFHEENGDVCPAGWTPGAAGLHAAGAASSLAEHADKLGAEPAAFGARRPPPARSPSSGATSHVARPSSCALSSRLSPVGLLLAGARGVRKNGDGTVTSTGGRGPRGGA
jgi:hypothetical protein